MSEMVDEPLGGAFLTDPGMVPQPMFWADNVGNWNQILRLYNDDEEFKASSLSRLRSPQRTSMQILIEWWYNDTLPHSAELKAWLRTGDGLVPKVTGSNYEKSLFELWLWEIGTYVAPRWQKHDLYITLNIKRQHAAGVAAAYRLSIATLSEHTIGDHRQDSKKFKARKMISACTDACPWIEPEQVDNGYPYYVWDIEQRVTIRFPDTCPPYLVISHTWGRWAIDGTTSDVPGVPWEVPVNTLFDVQDIPNMLSRLPFDVKYVWLDLVCIPQDGSDRQRSEIARQTTIFKAAKYATIWLSGVANFDGIRSAVNWLSLAYLRFHERQTNIDDVFATAIESQAIQTSGLARPLRDNIVRPETLLLPGKELNMEGGREPDGWFTSLWTLQEACLRPDMFVCDLHWNLLSVGQGTSRVPITLDNFVALFNLGWEGRDGKEPVDVPLSVKEVAGILMRTAMHKLLDLSAIDILTLGNQRYCKDPNRAKAVMSALGVVDWYKKDPLAYDAATPTTRPKFILTSGYPLEFVEAVKAKFGSLIFAASDISPIDLSNYRMDWRRRLKSTSLTATMLPFGSRPLQQRYLLMNSFGIEDEPCVKDWVVNQDGSVSIKKASILASCPSTNSAQVTAWVQAVPAGEYLREEVDIAEWLLSFRSSNEKHAICIFRRASIFCHGIIIERLHSTKSGSRPKKFIKIGMFWFDVAGEKGQQNVVEFPAQHDCDWLVI